MCCFYHIIGKELSNYFEGRQSGKQMVNIAEYLLYFCHIEEIEAHTINYKRDLTLYV